MTTKKYTDDTFIHLAEDIEKIRQKYMMYISFSGSNAARVVFTEILFNAIDECRNPRSPGNRIDIEYHENTDTIIVTDNGRGIPTDVLELVLTTLNSGSNIDSSAKNELEVGTLGRNGVGTLAMTALGEYTEVISYRGGTENKMKRLVFNEGKKVLEEGDKCPENKHGLKVIYKPSKILGKSTKIVWPHIKEMLDNIQFLNAKNIKMISIYHDKRDNVIKDEYKTQKFENILSFKNTKEKLISDKYLITIEDKNVIEEIGSKKYKRFIFMEIAFAYTTDDVPYIDSFCNMNNTIDNGSHLSGTIEGLCRYFQQITKSSLSDRDKLDIKWDDIKLGLSVVVSLSTNMEELFTSQTKHKISNDELEKLIRDLTIESLAKYFKDNSTKLKEMINLVKINARARRESDKARNAVVKDTMTNWSSFKMKNYDPCTNKGKEYKELYIIEGDSAKGSLKLARDPKFQALFAIRGVSANVFKMTLDQIVGPNGNKEFNDLIKVMGCNVGNKFDLSRLQFNKIIIASDADIDGLFIRSLLLSFFLKLFPEIIEDGRLFIAEPPLYRVNDKRDPFVINKEDYIQRYAKNTAKEYVVSLGIDKLLSRDDLEELLNDTNNYLDDIRMLSNHYHLNDRLVELIVEELALCD